MTGFESAPFGKRTINSPQPQTKMREFNVGSEEDQPQYQQKSQLHNDTPNYQPGQELSFSEREELNRLRIEQVGQGKRISEHAKKRIEILANIGRLTRDVTIEGVAFSLRTLKAKEAQEALLSVFKSINDADAAYEIRKHSLARSIYRIDGQEIDLALGGSDFMLKLQLIDDMEETIVNKLYNEFNELRQEVRVKFGLETDAQVKEVVEDIKK